MCSVIKAPGPHASPLPFLHVMSVPPYVAGQVDGEATLSTVKAATWQQQREMSQRPFHILRASAKQGRC